MSELMTNDKRAGRGVAEAAVGLAEHAQLKVKKPNRMGIYEIIFDDFVEFQ